jgi:hypothetical protein
MKHPEVSSLRILTPLPKTLWQSNCSLCDKMQARWTARGTVAPVFLCSLCLLYETAWGKRNAAEIEATKALVEKGREKPLPVQDGKLFNCADADSVLGVIVLVERTLARMPNG